ncbi:EI24 domain-containing protein [Stackebrandtia endophytica]|uniref:EI24 domain-containing protein n=1 Tax=Stackebrandtia endophytica TaxID=1496996 RepID=UPI0011514760|nr:EI24 domain-containing protein [Stackebrandtia endophytica]
MNNFILGVKYLFRGIGYWGRRPKVMLLGAIPALIATALLVGGLVALAMNLTDLSAWLTGFADDWGGFWRTSVQVVAGILVFAFAGWISILMFTALTLIIGDPFYEAINGRVEAEYGPVNEVEVGFWAGLGRSIGDSLRLLLVSVPLGILLFALGFIPVVGTILALVLGAFIGGWFLAVELTAYPFNRRGIRYGQYRRMLGSRRSMAVGFGTTVFLLFLIPLGAVIVMPAAVAGGTLMARDVLGENTIRRG